MSKPTKVVTDSVAFKNEVSKKSDTTSKQDAPKSTKAAKPCTTVVLDGFMNLCSKCGHYHA